MRVESFTLFTSTYSRIEHMLILNNFTNSLTKSQLALWSDFQGFLRYGYVPTIRKFSNNCYSIEQISDVYFTDNKVTL